MIIGCIIGSSLTQNEFFTGTACTCSGVYSVCCISPVLQANGDDMNSNRVARDKASIYVLDFVNSAAYDMTDLVSPCRNCLGDMRPQSSHCEKWQGPPVLTPCRSRALMSELQIPTNQIRVKIQKHHAPPAEEQHVWKISSWWLLKYLKTFDL